MSQNPSLGNAAGTCKTVEQLRVLLRSAADTATLGSVTIEEGSGNPGTNHCRNEAGSSVNSLGLPNPGLAYYQEHLSEMVEMAHVAGKRLSANIAPKEQGDTEKLARAFSEARINKIELNAGCPNVWSLDGKQKRILSFDPDALDRELRIFLSVVPAQSGIERRVKLSPYSDPVLLREVAEVLGQYEITLVTSNTFPNAIMFWYFEGKRRYGVEFGRHLGGFSGKEFRHIVLGQVEQFRALLPYHPIIGVGGVNLGTDMAEYLAVGATGVQVGSAYYYREDPRIFTEILEGYAQYLETLPTEA